MATSKYTWSTLLFLILSTTSTGHRINTVHFSGQQSNDVLDGASDILSVTKSSCEDKFAKGLSCQVFVRFMGRLAFTLNVEESTTLGDLKRRFEMWIRDKANGRRADQHLEYNLLHRVNGHKRQLVGDNDATLISLGITVAESDIFAETRGLLGGLAYGTEVSVHGPSSFLWPTHDFVVQIYYADPRVRIRSLCTGFIQGNHVLTAAHCFYGKPSGYEEYMTVIAGDGSEHQVDSIHIIPGYNGGKGRLYASSADMAVATLVGSGYTPRVSVILRKDPITEPTRAYLSGFGMTESGGGPSRHRALVEGEFTVGDGKCSVHTRTGYVSPTLGCAHSGASATASCVGDSGGPWFLKEQNGTYSVFGVNMGADDCRGYPNPRATADFTMLSETRSFWEPFFS